MSTTIWSIWRSCKTCQTNKKIGPYTFNGRDDLQIDFMALTIIDHASRWFEILELPLVTQLQRQKVNGKELLTANKIFDKTSNRIARLVNRTWVYRCP
jgi:hypothetical protein